MWKKSEKKKEVHSEAPDMETNFQERDIPIPNLEPAIPSAVTEKSKIGTSVVIKGDLIAAEDIVIRGGIQGTVCVREHTLTVARSGNVQANIFAKKAIIEGKVQGNIHAYGQVEIRKPAMVIGNIIAPRVTLEDGGTLRGSIDMDKASIEKHFPNQQPVAQPNKATSNQIGQNQKAPATAEVVKSPSSATMQTNPKSTQPVDSKNMSSKNEFKAKTAEKSKTTGSLA